MNNQEFLETLFGGDWGDAHVTSFAEDPEAITASRRAVCWGGGAAKDRLSSFSEGENQYFTISLFEKDGGRAVRRKAMFDACFVIVADDVGEKLPKDRVELLPTPTYKLFTSEGSEQWGWVLEEPVEDRVKVENLLNGLVEQGLAPDGKDPGMRGVTRYVRLPDGSNTKGKRCDAQGNPFKCYLSEWNPDNLYSIETLADVFGIDLFRAVDGGEVSIGLSMDNELVKEHPLLPLLNVTGVGADGWVRIDCPNADAHSSDDASGAAVQFQDDGRVHFQCHHGGCNGDAETDKMTGERLIKLLDKTNEGLSTAVLEYKRAIDVAGTKALVEAGIAGEVETPLNSQSYEDSGNFDPNDWVFIPSSNRYYQLSRGVDMCKDALNSLYLSEFSGGRGKAKAADQLNMSRVDGSGVAEGFSWVPSAFGTHIERIVEHRGQRMINDWRGFDLTPAAGDVQPWLDLVEYLVPDEQERNLLLGWFAFMVQRPELKCQWQIIMRGEKGTGKDSMLAPIMRILGDSGNDISAEDLEGGWGDYFAKKKFVVMQEIHRPQDKKFSNMLKTVTASTSTGLHTYNLKGGRIITQPDVLSVFAFSNFRYCVALEENERRYLVLDCFFERKDTEFYNNYYAWLNDGGAAALFHYLLSIDNSEFPYWELPLQTEGYFDLISGGRADYEETIIDMINSQDGVFSLPLFELRQIKTELKDRGHTPGHKGIGVLLESQGYYKFRGQRKQDGVVVSTPTFWTNQLPKGTKPAEVFAFYEESVR